MAVAAGCVCVLTGVCLQGSGWCGRSSLSWYAAAFSSTGVRSSASSSSAARMRSTSSPTERLTTILTCPFISASILVSALHIPDDPTISSWLPWGVIITEHKQIFNIGFNYLFKIWIDRCSSCRKHSYPRIKLHPLLMHDKGLLLWPP